LRTFSGIGVYDRRTFGGAWWLGFALQEACIGQAVVAAEERALMLEDGLRGESGKLVVTVSLIERHDLEARTLGAAKRTLKFTLVTDAQENEMGMVEIGCAERCRLKSGMGRLHCDLSRRQVTANEDVDVALAGRGCYLVIQNHGSLQFGFVVSIRQRFHSTTRFSFCKAHFFVGLACDVGC